MADVSPGSSLLRDVSQGGTSVTQRQKFHTDDAKSVRNPVRSAHWLTVVSLFYSQTRSSIPVANELMNSFMEK